MACIAVSPFHRDDPSSQKFRKINEYLKGQVRPREWKGKYLALQNFHTKC